MASISLATRRRRVPMSTMPTTTPGPACAGEDEAHGVLALAHEERVDLAAGRAGGDGRADLQHVRTEHGRRGGPEVVGVVLHEGDAAVEALAHGLDDAHERRRLPVALGAEAVAVGHQPLGADAGQLLEAAEVLEGVDEGTEAALGQERPQAQLDARGVAQGLAPVAVRAAASGTTS